MAITHSGIDTGYWVGLAGPFTTRGEAQAFATVALVPAEAIEYVGPSASEVLAHLLDTVNADNQRRTTPRPTVTSTGHVVGYAYYSPYWRKAYLVVDADETTVTVQWSDGTTTQHMTQRGTDPRVDTLNPPPDGTPPVQVQALPHP